MAMDTSKKSRNSVTEVCSLKSMENELKEVYQNDLQEVKLLLEMQARARKDLETQRSKSLETVDNFWITAISFHTVLYRLISRPSYVADLFKCFTTLDIKDYGSRYEIHFYFRENPFFSNEVLIKSYWYSSEWNGHHVSTNSEIQWKNPKFAELISNCVNEIVDSEYPSFFTWFLDNFHPELDEYGHMFKKDFWPNAVSYYVRSQNKREGSCDTENESEVEQIGFNTSSSAYDMEEIDYGQYDADVNLSTDEETTDDI